MKFNIIQYQLPLWVMIFNYILKRVVGQTANNECNIEHCVTCDKTTKLCIQCEQNFYFQKEQILCVEEPICDIGQYKVDRDSQCIDCHQTCKSCYGPGAKDCYECIDGYFFQQDFYSGGDYNCRPCSIDNCEQCYSQDVCSICADGYLLNKVTGKCEACSVSSCQECNKDLSICDLCQSSYQLQSLNNSLKCILKGSCSIGYYENAGNCTQQCHKSCLHCYGPGEDNCYQCASGYYLDGSKCLQCNSPCLTCKGSPNFCTSCSNSLELNGSKCLSTCNIGEFNNNGKCDLCPPNCLVCTDSNTCTSCIDPSQYTISQGKCIGICGSGKYNQLSGSDLSYWKQGQYKKITSTPFCKDCSSNCKECTFSSSQCTLCKDGQVLSNSKCTNSCQPYEYLDFDPFLNMKRCIPCPYPCASCNDRFTCKTCLYDYQLKDGKCLYNGYVLSACDEGQVNFSSLCLDSCPQGTILEGSVCNCDFSCNTCLLNVSNMQTECILCKNQSYYSSQGVCQTSCPSNLYSTLKMYKNQFYTYQYNGCVEKCPPNTLSQISKDKRECVTKCSPGFTLYQNTMCLNLPCQSGTYFDSASYQNVVNNKGDITNQSLYCLPCDPACAICDGNSNKNCIKCIDNYVVQKRVENNSSVAYCLNQCDQGYTKTKWQQADNTYLLTCSVCLKQCTSCLSTYYKILSNQMDSTLTGSNLYNCYSTCPEGTVANDQKLECVIQTSVDVFLDYTDSVDKLFCTQSNINVFLQISTIIQLTSDPQISCTLVELQTPLLMKNQGSGKFSKYSGVIPANTLQEGSTYNVECTVSILNQDYESTQQLETFKLNRGNFSLDKYSGNAVNDTFTININSFSLDQIDTDDYVLQYKLDVQMSTVSIPFSNITIFQTDSLFYRQYPDLVKDFNFQFKYSFPQISASMNVTMYLTVFGPSTLSKTFSQNILLQPFDEKENLKLVSAALQSILSQINNQDNHQLTMNDLEQFSSSLMAINLVPFLDVGLKAEIANQKMLSNIPNISNLIKCNSVDDCSGHGNCKQNITSYYQKCDCEDGYAGETCSWKSVDLNIVQKLYYSSLDTLSQELLSVQSMQNPLDSQQKLNAVVDELNSMVQIRDIFNSDVANKFLNLVNNDQLYSPFNSPSSLAKLLQINDNTLDILRKISSSQQVTVGQIASIKQNFIKSLNQQANYLKPGQPSRFSLNNVNGLIQDLTYSLYGHEPNLVMQGDASQQWQVSIPTSLLGRDTSNIYSQAIVWPSDLEELVHNYTLTQFSLPVSNIIDITILQKDDPTKEVLISNSPSPIYISMNRQIQDSDLVNYKGTYTLNCTYQLPDGSWTSNGLQLTKIGDNIQCTTNHLTSFSLRILSYNSNLFQTPTSDDIGNNFNSEAFIICNFLVILAIGHMQGLIAARKLSIKNNQNALQIDRNDNEQRQDLPQQQQGHHRQGADSIFNSPSPLIYPIKPDNNEMKLEGIHVAGCDEPKMIEGVPIYQQDGETNTAQKSQNKKLQDTNKLPINQIDFNNVQTLQNNPEKYDKIAQNIARRAKENEIDLCNSDQKPDKDRDTREVNLIPISTFYQPINQASPQLNSQQQQLINNQLDQAKQCPFTLEISPNLPQGVPINENQEENKEVIQQPPSMELNNEIIQSRNDMLYYHPLYSFSRPLEVTQIPIRIFLFFQIIALYEQISIQVLTKKDGQIIDKLSIGLMIQLFFQAMITKSVLQFIIPVFLSIVSFIERLCFSSSKFSSSSPLRYICILTFTIFSLIDFTIKVNSLETMGNFLKFVLVFVIAVFIDYFLMDFVIIKLQLCCKSNFIRRMIKSKNLDLRT